MGMSVWQPQGQPAPGQLAQLNWTYMAWFIKNSFINKWLCSLTGLSDTRIVLAGRASDLNERADLRREGSGP